MPKTKIAVTLDERLLDQLDALVREAHFPNRSQAIEAAVEEKLARLARAAERPGAIGVRAARLARTRLARECSKLDPDEERALAEEGLSAELAEWPEY